MLCSHLIMPLDLKPRRQAITLVPNISMLTKSKVKILTKPCFRMLTRIQLRNLNQTSAANKDQTPASKYRLNFNFKILTEVPKV